MRFLWAFRYNPLRAPSGRQQNCVRNFAPITSRSQFCSARNLCIRQGLFRASCQEALLPKTRLRVRLLGHDKIAWFVTKHVA
ncbi:MAG: hypothetical protein LBK44_04830 [Spirochaetales bacterium]|nr:hypothetical protein [Spirochaetales bacterium]